MKCLSIFSVLLLSAIIGTAQSLSPNVVSSWGTLGESADGSLSSTAGEPMTETYSTQDQALTQGFHQSLLFGGPPSSVQERSDDGNFGISVYPNPVRGKVRVEFSTRNPEDIRFQLYTVKGKRLEVPFDRSGSGDRLFYRIDMNGLSQGFYFLRVLDTDSGRSHTEKLSKE